MACNAALIVSMMTAKTWSNVTSRRMNLSKPDFVFILLFIESFPGLVSLMMSFTSINVLLVDY